MRQIFVFLFVIVYFDTIGQNQDFSLTKSNLKKLFNTPPDICCVKLPSEWVFCCSTDSEYYKLDTIKLINDKYYTFERKSYPKIIWVFKNSKTFTLIENTVSSISKISIHNFNFKIKFKKEGNYIVLRIFKDGNLKDKFKAISLSFKEISDGKAGYQLTLVRLRKTFKTEEH